MLKPQHTIVQGEPENCRIGRRHKSNTEIHSMFIKSSIKYVYTSVSHVNWTILSHYLSLKVYFLFQSFLVIIVLKGSTE